LGLFAGNEIRYEFDDDDSDDDDSHYDDDNNNFDAI